jgi:hypothetical protein
MKRRVPAALVLALALAAGAAACKGKHAPRVDAHKLVVTRAIWGASYDGLTTDVTELVRGLVKQDALNVTASIALLGDPAAGKIKNLRVEYQKGGAFAKKMVGEGSTLAIGFDEKAAPLRLVVTKAVYGNFVDGQIVDVSYKVADMVKDDALSVSNYNILFGDPAPNKRKELRVEYTLDGQVKSKVLSETEPLVLSATGPGR